jgi:uncharacterized membrane protein YfcA
MMTANELITILFFGSLLAGFIGSLSGLGGGMIIIPLLTIVLGVDIHYAIGASLIAVIATSTGASSAYVKEGFTKIRAGIFLETATTTGALVGVAIGVYLSASLLSLIFGLVLFYSALNAYSANGGDRHALPPDAPADPLATRLLLDDFYPSDIGLVAYHVARVPLGWTIMFMAGALSGILGIGSGALKVIALDQVMGFPFKVSTATSNFMIGVTAAASAGIYLHRGYIDPLLSLPVMLGVVTGSLVGAALLPRIKTKHLRKLFAAIIMIISLQMIYKGIT